MLVGEEGLEPSISIEKQILSLLRLPISPLTRCYFYTYFADPLAHSYAL